MSNGNEYKHLIFDFDGVLAESNEVRFAGFAALFADYPPAQVERLLDFARRNGGMSRYAKIRFFFENIREESVSEAVVKELAGGYSRLVTEQVIAARPVKGSLEFLREQGRNYDLAIISGSDELELRHICAARGIAAYFEYILGSPGDKEERLDWLLNKTGWEQDRCLFIGDSINDLRAAQASGIDFIARDSGPQDWGDIEGVSVIEDISGLEAHLTRIIRGKKAPQLTGGNRLMRVLYGRKLSGLRARRRITKYQGGPFRGPRQRKGER